MVTANPHQTCPARPSLRVAAREACLPGAVILVGLVLVFRGDLLIGSDFFFKATRDISPFLSWYPWSRLAADSWGQGLFPLWNPYNFLGLPLLGNYQSSVFSPLLWPLYLPLDAVTAPYLVGRLWLAGMGAWWLGRRVGQSNAGATVAGVAFGLTGYLIQHVNVQHVVIDLLIPYLIIAGMELLDRPRLKSFLALAAVTALVLLGGQPGAALFTLAFGYGYLVLHAVAAPGADRPGAAGRPCRLLLVGLAAAPAILVATIQLLPFFEFIPQAWTFHLPSFGSEHIPWRGTITAVAAGFYGPLYGARQVMAVEGHTLIHLAPYVGMTVVVLALTAALRPRRLFDAWLVAVLIVGGSILFGLPPLCWLTHLPGLGQLTFIKYLQPVLAFCLALLAGRGADELAAGNARRWLSALAAITILGLIITLAWPGSMADALLPGHASFLIRHDSLLGGIIAAISFILFVAVIGVTRPRDGAGEHAVRPSLLALVLIELVLASFTNWRLMSRNVAREDFSPVGEALTACAPPGALIMPRAAATEDLLLPAMNLLVPYFEIGGPEALIPRPSHEIIRALSGATEEQFLLDFLKYNAVRGPVTRERSNAARLAGLGVTLSRKPLKEPGLAEDQFVRGVHVYCDQPPAPRIYLARKIVAADTLAEMLKVYALDTAFVPPAALAASGLSSTPAGGKVSRVDYGLQRVTADIAPDGGGLLVLADAYFPGWRARVDGREVKIIRANHAVRGVAVAAGDREVEFVYQPWSFRLGLWLGLVSLAVTAVAFVAQASRPANSGNAGLEACGTKGGTR